MTRVIFALLLLSAPASADTIHLAAGAKCTTPSGVKLTLPPSHVVEDPVWALLDTEVRRLQDAETGLTAENESLRKSAEPAGWGTWGLVASAFAAGITLGMTAF